MGHFCTAILCTCVVFLCSFCKSKDPNFLYHHEINEREKNLDFCVINKIHKNESNLISYSRTGHRNVSDTSHITYFKVRFHVNRGVEIEKEDSIAFYKTDKGHWNCEECPSVSHTN